MKNKKKIIFNCACGCGRQTITLHELIPGNGNRKICEDYNIQLPLCIYCHTVAHLRFLRNDFSPLLKFTKKQNGTELKLDNELIKKNLFEILNVDMYSTLKAMSPGNSREYLDQIKYICLQGIMSFQAC